MGYDLEKIPAQTAPHSTYQDYLDRDSRTPPEIFREVGTEDMGTENIPVEHYTSRDFYERERAMWDSVWQMACREEHISNPGDFEIYEVARRSYLVVRTQSGEIKAYPNVCLHRGRKLRLEAGNAGELRCPFHGFTWTLEGDIAHVPCEWDFPQIDKDDFGLPEVQVGTWAGWVFINPDPNAPALMDYLDPIARHYEPYAWDQSYMGVHVAKVLRGNWKVIQEAFMESFHALDTHPQIVGSVDDFGCQYDVWEDKPHVNRMMVPFAAPSSYVVDQVDEQSVLEEWTGQSPQELKSGGIEVGEGETARQVVARLNRETVSKMMGRSLDDVSDAEMVDGWYYNVFPNLMFWGGFGPNMWYRFRPHEDSHEKTLMEVGFIMRHPKDEPKPEPFQIVVLDEETPWASVDALGNLGFVLDQDTTNMAAIQEGLNATFKPGVTLAHYQENRIRHFHRTLRRYIAEPKSPQESRPI